VTEPLIEVTGLHHHYDDGTAALGGVDFVLHPGESVALLGANGSGKTTFILCLTGLLAGHGAARVCGLPVESANLPAIRRKLGVVFQDSESQLFMPTVLEDVAFGPLNLGMAPADAQTRAREMLRHVGMEAAAAKAPYHLSAGEKKRVAIAGILAMQPDILALDEPTTFLDPPAQRALIQLLRDLPQAKIVVTHDVAFARAVCTRAVFFDRGKIVGEGPVDDLVRRFAWDPQVESPGRAAR
jgi:cobalt/nickel transport system ATP-binding protein